VSFGEIVSQFVGQTNQSQMAADDSVRQLVTGQTDDVQQVVLAVAQADLSFQMFMEIRNKLIDNYNELMRMQF
jgi:flagellar hook-basal body complex protein FliE